MAQSVGFVYTKQGVYPFGNSTTFSKTDIPVQSDDFTVKLWISALWSLTMLISIVKFFCQCLYESQQQ